MASKAMADEPWMAFETGSALPSGGAAHLRARLDGDAAHARKVEAVVATVRGRKPGQLVSIRKPGMHHTPHSQDYKKGAQLVDVAALTSVVSVDTENMLVVCEGAVTMDSLVQACVPHNVLPQVLPEIRDFSVAGLLNGLGIESSSHRYGGYVDTVDAFEMVLADGSVVTADEAGDRSDLFRTAAGAYGTLGVVTALTLRLQPVSSHVRTAYYLFDDLKSYCRAMKDATGAPGTGKPRFVEGFLFAPDRGVLMLGECVDLVDGAAAPGSELSGAGVGSGRARVIPQLDRAAAGAHAWDPTVRGKEWIHQHALTTAGGGWPAGAAEPAGVAAPAVGARFATRRDGFADRRAFAGAASAGWDVMTVQHYLFRHERGWLWTLEQFAGMPGLTSTELGRGLVEDAAAAEYAELNKGIGGFIGSSARNPSFTQEDLERNFAHQDTIWHVDRLEEGVRIVADEVAVWPLWHCPALCDDRPKGPFTAIRRGPGLARPCMMVDMGLYGEATAPHYRFRSSMRRVQNAADLATAFGYLYLSPGELARHWDLALYDRVREEAGAADAFPHVLTKVSMFDDSKPDLGTYSMWRLKRAGLEGAAAALAAGVTVVVAAGVFLAVSPSARERVTGAIKAVFWPAQEA